MIIANFINKQDALVTGLDQYDYGQVLRIQGLKLPTAVEIHFGLEETGGTTTTRIGVTKDGVTDVIIPDSMLENGDTSLDYTIYAFIYLTDDTSGKTVHRIRMQVKARSKPELLNKPEDKELFQKAIEAVNQSAKEAEGWAHGREDMPERATDNAKYYSEQASGSAEEVKKVEQSVKDMVATVDGIEQQVQDVKEYTGQAKTAAKNALLSEQEAKKSEEASLQHRTGAETAENNAELAEQNAKKSEQAAEQAKQLVMQMGQEVLQNKNQVDEKVEAFNKVVTDAVDAVETVKTDAVGAVETAGTEQTKKVSDEGTKQVKAVEDKGNEVLQSIPEDFTTQMESKLNKQQGVENKGKALVVGEDGNVAVGEVQGGDGIPIINDMSGESPLVVPDSAERVNKGFSLLGKSEQLTTTGIQLFDISKCTLEHTDAAFKIKISDNNVDLMNGYVFDDKTQYILKADKVTNMNGNSAIFRFEYTDETRTDINVKDISNKSMISLVGKKVKRLALFNQYGGEHEVIGLQLIKGTTIKPYEPYTGGKPSPSPDYPQEIKNVGKWNEEKQKYEVNIRITNAKESWDKEQTITLTSDRPITKWDKLVEQDGQIGWLFNRKIDVMPKTGWVLHPNGYFYNGNVFKDSAINLVPIDENNLFTHFKLGNPSSIKDKSVAWLYVHTVGKTTLRIRIADETINTVEALEKYIADKDMKIMYELAVPEFVQLPQSEQDAIRALLTYYPTTVITADGGEVNPDIEVRYIADTKNYIDQKIAAIGKTVVETQKALL